MKDTLGLAFILFLLSATASVALLWDDAPPQSAPVLPILVKHRSMKQRYEVWLTRFNRTFSNRSEHDRRYRIYKLNVRYIDHFNLLDLPFTLTDNKFADLTNHEFRKAYLVYSKHKKHHEHWPKHREGDWSANMTEGGSEYLFASQHLIGDRKELLLPLRIKENAVKSYVVDANTPQRQELLAIAAVEGITKIRTKKSLSLSEQEILDCNADRDNQGCDGDLMDRAFLFIEQKRGITTESNYRYSASKGVCNRPKTKNHAASITGFRNVAHNEYSLQAAITVSVAIDAGGLKFQLYGRGIFTGSCGTELNHGVTSFGYETEGKRNYWIVKNSWGRNWSEDSYIRMEKGVHDRRGLCGIAMQASYPVKA